MPSGEVSERLSIAVNSVAHVASLPAVGDGSPPPLNTCTMSSAPPTTSPRARSSVVTGSARLFAPYLKCASRAFQRCPVTATVNARHGAASSGVDSAQAQSASSTARAVACFSRDAIRHASCDAMWSRSRSARASSASASTKARVSPRTESRFAGSIFKTTRWHLAIVCASGTSPRRSRSALCASSSSSSSLLESPLESLSLSLSLSLSSLSPLTTDLLPGDDGADLTNRLGFAAVLISSSRFTSISCAATLSASSLSARSSRTSLAPTTSPAAIRICARASARTGSPFSPVSSPFSCARKSASSASFASASMRRSSNWFHCLPPGPGAVVPVVLSGTRGCVSVPTLMNRDCLSHTPCLIKATSRRRLYECGTRRAAPLDPFGGTTARSSRKSSAAARSGSLNRS